MSVARTWAVATNGARSDLIEVEADVTPHTPEFRIIGLPDRALGEATRRVQNACVHRGVPLPRQRLTVNLSPAAVPKQGSGFDLAVAVAALATERPLVEDSVRSTIHIGELGLDGRVRPVDGVLPAVAAAARAGLRRAVVPWGNRKEAALVPDIEVRGVISLADALALHGLEIEPPDLEPVERGARPASDGPSRDLADVVGQVAAVEALVIAAAGGHHLLMTGPPGAGKTMLAERLPGILPPLTPEEAMEVAAIRSLSGLPVDTLPDVPPFEAPHHTASVAALVGGGSQRLRPGAIARASAGVLFLDEAGEFRASAMDALRQPLESGRISIHRAAGVAEYPARVHLVMATNPCPCGHHGIPDGTCVCPPQAVRRYRARLSGPVRDRVDIELALRRVRAAEGTGGTSSTAARERVAAARDAAAARWSGTPWRRNADVAGSWLRTGPHALAPAVRRPLDVALERGALTLRGYDRVLRLAWTLADLDDRVRPGPEHIGRALFLRTGGDAR